MAESRGPAPVAVAARLAAVDEVELVIEKLVAGGDGLGRFEGIPVFVARAAPGDRLRIRIVERRPDYARGEILAVLTPGPGRREPPCPAFARCGGCDLQHLDDDLQLELKAAATRESLERLGGLTLPAQIAVIRGSAWGYRLRTQLHVEPVAEGLPRVGYHARGSHQLVAVDRCPVLHPVLERTLATLPELMPADPPRRLDLAVGDGDGMSVAPVVPGMPHGDVRLTVGEHTYGFDARCFFQGHRGLLPQLVETVVGGERGERAADLFAGVGLFSLPLARRYRSVVAVEGDRVAARHARTNARRAGLAVGGGGGIEVVAQAVESWVATLPDGLDRVVVDPPRAGLPRVVRAALLARRPRRLTYVSCHAATLARDLRELRAGFALEAVTFVDLFPQTGHLETVVQLAGVS